jgi:hypothetical protein
VSRDHSSKLNYIPVKLFWMIIAAICIVVAAVFLLRRDLNTAFVIAVLGLVAWFLNYRAQMKAIIVAADAEQNDQADEADSYENSDND